MVKGIVPDNSSKYILFTAYSYTTNEVDFHFTVLKNTTGRTLSWNPYEDRFQLDGTYTQNYTISATPSALFTSNFTSRYSKVNISEDVIGIEINNGVSDIWAMSNNDNLPVTFKIEIYE